LEKLYFGEVTAIFIGIRFCAPDFIQIRRFFIDGALTNSTWRRPKFAVCHVTFFGMPFCFILQRIAEIGRCLAELISKNDFQDGGRPPS